MLIGCGSPNSGTAKVAVAAPANLPDKDSAAAADPAFGVLFVGNSHTAMHDLPEVVARMIRARHPGKNVRVRHFSCGFLEDAAGNAELRRAIESKSWGHLVLQAQKESMSGKYVYSRAEGIELAKLGRAHGMKVTFYAEWGVKGSAGHAERIERMYSEMATASGARVAPVGRAWDRALSDRPTLPLHDPDGNHQSSLGAFLTASVLFGRLMDQNPTTLEDFPWDGLSKSDRALLLRAAVDTLGEDGKEAKPAP
jgi:hypothetical protein